MAAKIPAIETLSAESQALYDAVNDERDLPCVLISASFIDQCLASLLERFFINSSMAQSLLNPGCGSVGTFSARADLCYCLGLIPKGLFHNLQTLGKIRNKFAHSYLSLSFADCEVAKWCESLTFPIASGKRVDCETGTSHDIQDPWAKFTHPKTKFTVCVVMMANRLMLTGLSTEHCPRQEQGWN